MTCLPADVSPALLRAFERLHGPFRPRVDVLVAGLGLDPREILPAVVRQDLQRPES